MADVDARVEEADARAEAVAKAEATSKLDEAKKTKKKKHKKTTDSAEAAASSMNNNGGVSSPRYPPNLKLPPAPASMVSSVKDAKTKVAMRAAYEWSAASEETRSKYALKAKTDKERFLKEAERIAFENFFATVIQGLSAQSAACSSSSMTGMAKRAWRGVNAVTRALHFHDGIEHLIADYYASKESRRAKRGSRAGVSGGSGGGAQLLPTYGDFGAREDDKQGFYHGRRVVCTVNRYIVVKDADPRGKFEVGRLINVFKRGLIPSSTGKWQINVVMEIVNHGKIARIAPLIGSGNEGMNMVHKDDPKTVWVMLPLSLGSPNAE